MAEQLTVDAETDLLLSAVDRAIAADFGRAQHLLKPGSLSDVVGACNCSIQEEETGGAWAHS